MGYIRQSNWSQFFGKKIIAVKDEYDNDIKETVMMHRFVLVFDDGDRLMISTDWRGDDCYISARTENDQKYAASCHV